MKNHKASKKRKPNELVINHYRGKLGVSENAKTAPVGVRGGGMGGRGG